MASFACGPTIVLDEPEAGSDGDPTTNAGPVWPTSTTTTTSPSPTSTSTSTSTTSCQDMDCTLDGDSQDSNVFLPGPDDYPPAIECSLFDQDCPRGEKCMPWANDGGGAWNATRCSPVVDDPDAVGEPCVVEGSGVSGIDSCDYGAMCFWVAPETNEGTCMPFCVGDEESPTCDDSTYECMITGSGLPSLCLPICNPLLDDCPGDLMCTSDFGDLVCVPTVLDPLPIGEPCEYVNHCEPGAFCAPDVVPGCLGPWCCSAFCDLSDPMPPCLPGQACEPWYPVGTAPEGLETLGACTIP